MKILVIEDDKEITECIQLAFKVGWPFTEVICSRQGSEGLKYLGEKKFDAVLLDLGLPDIDGIDVLKQIRAFSNIPVVVMTVRSEEISVIRCLEAGADEYIRKPFGQMELLARLKVVLRRQIPLQGEPTAIVGPFAFSYSYRKVVSRGKDVFLTTTEGLILKKLAENIGRIVSYSMLAETIWGEDYPGAVESIRVYILRLRKKLEVDPKHPAIIISHANLGYSLSTSP